MKEQIIVITARDIQERNRRVRDLLRRGYMPIEFFIREKERVAVTEGRYVDKHGRQQRVKEAEYRRSYCVKLRRVVRGA